MKRGRIAGACGRTIHMIDVSKLGEVVAVGFVVVDVPDGALGWLGVGSIDSAGNGVGLGDVEGWDGDVSVGLHD